MREVDWAATSIGHPSTWPSALHATIRLMLASRYAMWLGWGPELTFFYNDAYRVETLGKKHPRALGSPASEVWAEIWEPIGPRIRHVLETGEATWDEGLLLFLERSGYREETYHTFSYSPAFDDEGKTRGLFCVVVEETERVIGERRIAVLQDLASALASTKTQPEVLRAVERVVRDAARKMTFSVTYLADDEGEFHRGASSGLTPDHPCAPSTIRPGEPSDRWRVAEVVATDAPLVAELSADHEWPDATWGKPSSHALVLPIHLAGRTAVAGVFVAGLSPFRRIDDGVIRFFELFVGQLAAGLGNALAYEESEERAQALAELDRAKTAFFSNVSHELRTPLTLMLGPTEDALASSDRALRGSALELVHRNELRLLKLVNTLLDFARIEAGRAKAHFQRVDLTALTVDLASAFRSTMERGGLELVVEAAPLERSVYVDRDMWEKIVLNLLSNAFKFTFEGTVRVSVSEEEERVVLRVSDTGVGIAPENVPHVFDRFHRIEGARSRTHEGTGIGLALVRDLVQLHGGAIAVASTPGEGTTFTVTLPFGRDHLPAEHVSDEGEPTRDGIRAASFLAEAARWLPRGADEGPRSSGDPGVVADDRARIVVADDNRDMRDYVARLLGEHWRVDAVADGVEALDAIERDPPALLVSDVMMPRIDGFELVRRLRANRATASLPILLLSARAGEEEAAVGLRTGADDYLVKPFSASALVVRVEALLARARYREVLRRTEEDAQARVLAGLMEGPAAIGVLAGANLTVEVLNPAAHRVLGLTESVIGRPIFDVAPALREQGFEDLMREVMRTGKPYRADAAPVRVLEGGVMREKFVDFVFARLSPGDDGEGRLLGWGFEVTALVVERRAAEAARADAEIANRAKDEFLATMSHELRTPLNAILGWSSLLLRDADDPGRRTKALETIERNARAQARLIEDVLEVSRIITGKLRIEPRRTKVATVVAAALDVVRPAAEAKGIALRSRIDEDLGDIWADPDRLQQIVWNLLSNAVKFTGQKGTIDVEVSRTESRVRIAVTDDGMGIPPQHLPYVFDRFRQVDSSTTRRFGGLGLGLAIVRHLAEMHGGKVSASSEGEGKGASFVVDLPIRALAPRDGASTRAAPSSKGAEVQAESATRTLAGVRVLVVDDDEDSRLLVTATLGEAGALTVAAESAAAALVELEGAPFDVLLSDIGMPDEDGYQLLAAVRSHANAKVASIPAVALTAYARPVDAARAYGAGFDHHLAKPVDPEVIVELVARASARRRD
ncbi:MAG: response regulator [Deltaproteobacteria bacterium]|nr:response regulator [Deltaproteobacteria bacterium]